METPKMPPTARAAVVWSTITADLAAQPVRAADGPCRVIDVGGGTGGFAVPLAQAGYDVTVIDPSPNALAALNRRADDAGVAARIVGMQADADALTELIEPGSARMVVCHSVLEMVDSPRDAVAAIRAVLAPGGAASLLVANRVGAVLARALAGHLSGAVSLLRDPEGKTARDQLSRRFDLASLSQLAVECGLVPEQSHGVQVVADLVHGDAESAEALREFELAVSGLGPYRDIASQIHVLARKPEQPERGSQPH